MRERKLRSTAERLLRFRGSLIPYTCYIYKIKRKVKNKNTMRICSLSVPRLKHEWNQTVWSVNNLRCGTAALPNKTSCALGSESVWVFERLRHEPKIQTDPLMCVAARRGPPAASLDSRYIRVWYHPPAVILRRDSKPETLDLR